MTNTNALAGIRCPKCGSEARFDVAAEVWATVGDTGVEDTSDTEWGDDAETRCGSCNHRATWWDFQIVNQRPYSVCVQCRAVIDWDGTGWRDREDVEDEVGDNYICTKVETSPLHQPLWLTLGELRDRTKHLPDYMPVTVSPEGDGVPEWMNLRLADVPFPTWDPEGDDQSSLILSAHDDFDTRQW
jgi:hypothetical protein